MGMAGLYVGLSGLQTSSNSLNTTANNLANVNTSGYVRQQVVNGDKSYNFVGTTAATTTGQKGLGVSIAKINHVRDMFLDAAYRKEYGRQAFMINYTIRFSYSRWIYRLSPRREMANESTFGVVGMMRATSYNMSPHRLMLPIK